MRTSGAPGEGRAKLAGTTLVGQTFCLDAAGMQAPDWGLLTAEIG